MTIHRNEIYDTGAARLKSNDCAGQTGQLVANKCSLLAADDFNGLPFKALQSGLDAGMPIPGADPGRVGADPGWADPT
jgi:hypothetical protein